MLLKVTAAPEQEKRLHRDPEHQDFGSELWIFMVSQQWPTSVLELENLEAWKKWLHNPVAGGSTTCKYLEVTFFISVIKKMKIKGKIQQKIQIYLEFTAMKPFWQKTPSQLHLRAFHTAHWYLQRLPAAKPAKVNSGKSHNACHFDCKSDLIKFFSLV